MLRIRANTRCFKCYRAHIIPFSLPPPPPLPNFRTMVVYPFQHVGVDYFGPFNLKQEVWNADGLPLRMKGEGKKEGKLIALPPTKCYVAIFTCLGYRAVEHHRDIPENSQRRRSRSRNRSRLRTHGQNSRFNQAFIRYPRSQRRRSPFRCPTPARNRPRSRRQAQVKFKRRPPGRRKLPKATQGYVNNLKVVTKPNPTFNRTLEGLQSQDTKASTPELHTLTSQHTRIGK